MLNSVQLIGRLGQDPQVGYTPTGIMVCNFSIAVPQMVRPDQNGNRPVDWIDIVAWRGNADFAANYLGKGRLVAVDGRIQTRTWTAQDGTRRKSVEVVVERLHALDRPTQAVEVPHAPKAQPGSQRPPGTDRAQSAPAWSPPETQQPVQQAPPQGVHPGGIWANQLRERQMGQQTPSYEPHPLRAETSGLDDSVSRHPSQYQLPLGEESEFRDPFNDEVTVSA